MRKRHALVKKKYLGAVLIYVLWILVVISILAFQLTSSNRVITLNHSAVSAQLKNRMQVNSAVQFAIFKIITNQWKDKKYTINLNNQDIGIQIFNEVGFISFYKLRNESLKYIFNLINIDQSTTENILDVVKSDETLNYNSFDELHQFEAINKEVLDKLIQIVSIFHEDEVNPSYSPENVLVLLPGVDQFSVRKLLETSDEIEREQLRNSIVDSLETRGLAYSDDIGSYFRVYITLEDLVYRIFLKYDHRQKSYKVVLENIILKEAV
ncbi:MAG: hypothetical protein GY744_20105 [Gammaproteobacteria bacterium]|nr:hypothetical protein [Gammaproteobacteria bacterium]